MNIRIFVVSCVMLGFTHDSQSQSSRNIDSLHVVLENTAGQSRISSLYALSYAYIENNNDEALRYAREGYRLSLLYLDSLHLVRTGLVMASVLRRTERHDSAANIYDSVLPIAARNGYVKEFTIGLNSAGITLTHLGEYDKALGHFFETLELRRSSRDTIGQLAVLNNIGTVYYKLKNYEKALEIFLECMKLQVSLGINVNADMASINAGHAYAYLGKYDSALYCLDLGIKLCGTECSPARFMEANFARGVVFFGLRDLTRSEGFFKRSYEIAKKEDNVRFELDNIDYLSQIYLARSDHRSAELFLKGGEDLLSEYPTFKLEASKLFSRFSELYYRTEQFQKAYDYKVKSAAMRDEVYSAYLTRNLMRIEADQLERVNLAKISSQQALLLLKEKEISNKRITNRLIALLALVSFAFALVLYRNYKQKFRISALLSIKIDEKTKQFQRNTDSLIKLSHERDTLLTQRSQMFKDFLHRVKGLCLVGLKETPDPVGRYYILKIDSLTREFAVDELDRTSSEFERQS